MESLKGTYNPWIYIDEGKMLIARDPMAYSCAWGKLKDTFIAVSESCALDAMNGEFLQDV